MKMLTVSPYVCSKIVGQSLDRCTATWILVRQIWGTEQNYSRYDGRASDRSLRYGVGRASKIETERGEGREGKIPLLFTF